MTTYISILRGINVSGQKMIKMDALRKSYESLGFHNVTSYLQSGNMVFTTDKNIELDEFTQIISDRIEKDFGFQIPVIVLSVDKLRQIVDTNPFAKENGKETAFLHVTFLSSLPDKYDLNALEEKKQNGEEISVTGNAIYLYCPNGYGRTKLNNTFLEAKLKMKATTRNWKTTTELLKIAQHMTKSIS
ncbi:DUF1697 domain-containing protein [Proteiniphilum sp.]|uniref:DUF1697 domain-containing protein n=1 Tax=Proteiniphilum sp. TaxID=1926877 RepID=UPI002B2183D3|nr:DUF1697 domain-containing protein [Proteiniphilum sp.]MEA4918965.1 DUF1697 domain-containing protein [Proteiniphilum sp.]